MEFLLLTGMVCAFSVNLSEGWNLISIPLDTEDKSPGWLCGEADCLAILAYDGESWRSYSPEKAGSFNTLDTIDESMGLWVYAGESKAFSVDGTLRKVPTDYHAGWNLVGCPGLESKAIEDTYDMSKIDMVLMFDAAWQVKGAADEMVPGFGYWVKAKEDFTIISNNAPVIDSITVTDDSPDPGFQVMPEADSPKEVLVDVLVTDPEGTEDIVSVEAMTPKGKIILDKISDIDPDTANYSGSFYMEYSDPPQGYDIIINASDGVADSASTAVFEYMELIALELDTDTIDFGTLSVEETRDILGDVDMGTNNPTIKNIGNSEIDVEISGEDMESASGIIEVDNIKYQLDEEGYVSLDGTPSYISLDLQAAAKNKIDLRITIPQGTPPEEYAGSITVSARK
ncbi:hypothetical protein KY358_04135 [Candidatus Woesearchaeota archaeon]|nr:hypothetical protein [Candidatus Woesearchaeota archaeon]